MTQGARVHNAAHEVLPRHSVLDLNRKETPRIRVAIKRDVEARSRLRRPRPVLLLI
jgi:hypothetical protein